MVKFYVYFFPLINTEIENIPSLFTFSHLRFLRVPMDGSIPKRSPCQYIRVGCNYFFQMSHFLAVLRKLLMICNAQFFFPVCFPCSREAAVPERWGVGGLPLAALFGPRWAEHLRPSLPLLPGPLSRHGHPLPAQPAVLPLLRGLAESCCKQTDKLNSGRTPWCAAWLLGITLDTAPKCLCFSI